MRKKWIIILGGVVLIMAIGAVFAFSMQQDVIHQICIIIFGA